MTDGLDSLARERRDLASLALFRVLFGLLVAWSAARFLLNGWVERFFVTPTYFFKYWGFEWLTVPGEVALYAMFGALVALGLMVAAGLFYRVAIVATFLIFTAIELMDVTNYLNHYYLVSLLALLMSFMPLEGMWSLDAHLDPRKRRDTIGAWAVWLMRFQVATVYFWAGVAKLGSDWLLHAQPLNIWLRARVDMPIVGPLFEHWWVALAMSWGGFLFDLTIWIWLLWPRTRRGAYLVVLAFHTSVGALFNIGLFPVIMMLAATVFFDPSWPRRFMPAPQPSRATPRPWNARLVAALAIPFCAFQLLMPARHWLYPGDVLWNEQGMRWSWKVMVREKNGAITYRVRYAGRAREFHVSPTRYLTAHQAREMSGQPDLILQLAHHIGEDYRARGHRDVEVRVDAIASLNGRPPARLIDPNVDLMTIEDGLAPATWILPAPEAPPVRLETHPLTVR